MTLQPGDLYSELGDVGFLVGLGGLGVSLGGFVGGFVVFGGTLVFGGGFGFFVFGGFFVLLFAFSLSSFSKKSIKPCIFLGQHHSFEPNDGDI
jgi:hypothetical protein